MRKTFSKNSIPKCHNILLKKKKKDIIYDHTESKIYNYIYTFNHCFYGLRKLLCILPDLTIYVDNIMTVIMT